MHTSPSRVVMLHMRWRLLPLLLVLLLSSLCADGSGGGEVSEPAKAPKVAATVVSTTAGIAPPQKVLLKSLTVSPGTLTPTFTSVNLKYTLAEDSEVEAVRVVANATDSGCQVKIGSDQRRATLSKPVPIQPGKMLPVHIQVICGSGSANRSTYTVDVTRAPPPPPPPPPPPDPSKDASLRSLNVTGGATLSANPGGGPFRPTVYLYSVVAPKNISRIKLMIRPNNTDATVRIDKTVPLKVNGTYETEVTVAVSDLYNVRILVTSADNSVNQQYTLRIGHSAKGKIVPDDYWEKFWGCGGPRKPCGWFWLALTAALVVLALAALGGAAASRARANAKAKYSVPEYRD